MKIFRLILLAVLLCFTACASMSRVLNPFYEAPTEVALKGEANDHALNPDKQKGDTAREVLEQMGTYRAAQMPQPNNPVIKPAIVRLMWVPDHLNRNGDLVPAHYYYLKIKGDSWAVQDAFELESQLNGPGGAVSSVPYIKR